MHIYIYIYICINAYISPFLRALGQVFDWLFPGLESLEESTAPHWEK
jgi:hypothetical protein